MDISRNKAKQILSLSRKKERKESLLFVAEGNKLVSDLLPLFRCKTLIGTEEFFKTLSCEKTEESIVTTKDQIEKISQMNSPQSALAVFYQPQYILNKEELKDKLTIMLDTVQDPGNLGTIIRIADWFGIENIICSEETVDLYNPKVIQATMGAIGRVRVYYSDLSVLLNELSEEIPVFGTFLEGNNIYETDLPSSGIILMGNEGNGISEKVADRVTHKLFIPNFPIGRKTSESLNVAVATAIVCSEFRRKR